VIFVYSSISEYKQIFEYKVTNPLRWLMNLCKYLKLGPSHRMIKPGIIFSSIIKLAKADVPDKARALPKPVVFIKFLLCIV
jgi:hypothetical protein